MLDDDSPRNTPADGVHNYLTRDGHATCGVAGRWPREAGRYGSLILRS